MFILYLSRYFGCTQLIMTLLSTSSINPLIKPKLKAFIKRISKNCESHRHLSEISLYDNILSFLFFWKIKSSRAVIRILTFRNSTFL